jgi:hypothetical protein
MARRFVRRSQRPAGTGSPCNRHHQADAPQQLAHHQRPRPILPMAGLASDAMCNGTDPVLFDLAARDCIKSRIDPPSATSGAVACSSATRHWPSPPAFVFDFEERAS